MVDVSSKRKKNCAGGRVSAFVLRNRTCGALPSNPKGDTARGARRPNYAGQAHVRFIRMCTRCALAIIAVTRARMRECVCASKVKTRRKRVRMGLVAASVGALPSRHVQGARQGHRNRTDLEAEVGGKTGTPENGQSGSDGVWRLNDQNFCWWTTIPWWLGCFSRRIFHPGRSSDRRGRADTLQRRSADRKIQQGDERSIAGCQPNAWPVPWQRRVAKAAKSLEINFWLHYKRVICQPTHPSAAGPTCRPPSSTALCQPVGDSLPL